MIPTKQLAAITAELDADAWRVAADLCEESGDMEQARLWRKAAEVLPWFLDLYMRIESPLPWDAGWNGVIVDSFFARAHCLLAGTPTTVQVRIWGALDPPPVRPTYFTFQRRPKTPGLWERRVTEIVLHVARILLVEKHA